MIIDTTSNIIAVKPLAVVRGEPLIEAPHDLYIPPDALEVFLEAFEGPLDLLLYLIQKDNIDILDIPMVAITEQYIQYVELMKHLKLELAAEYLVMAAWLIEIKSRMLLPRPKELETPETDPRAELVKRLQAYERIKHAAMMLDEIPQCQRDFFVGCVVTPKAPIYDLRPELSLAELIGALNKIMAQADRRGTFQILREPLSIRERMTTILSLLEEKNTLAFESLFTFDEGRRGVVVTFLALLELAKDKFIELIQMELFGPIHITKVIACSEAAPH